MHIKNTSVSYWVGDQIIKSHSKSDEFGRKVFDELQLGTGFVSRQFSYHTGEATEEHVENRKLKSSPTTQLVSSIALSDGRTLSYEYDEEERITKVTETFQGENVTVTEYTYDSLGQLLTEKVDGEIVNAMTYDNYGNIVSKNGVAYTYGDEHWKDLLTEYGNKTITYDAQGNPINYLGHTLTWEKGRQLKQFTKADGTVIDYAYNANGIRTSKTIKGSETEAGVTHNYTLDGTKILRETWTKDGVANSIVPMYDNEDFVCGIKYNGEPFYFQKNLQGDIIAILDKDADVVAKYAYDAWGVCTITEDGSGCNIAEVNPYRYRGYYFDAEIRLYYVSSRYYNPEFGRFINADEATYLGTSGTVLGYNLFVYCENNVINLYDPTGHDAMNLVLQSPLIAALSGALSGIMASIRVSIEGIKTAIATSPIIPVCVAAVAVSIVGIVGVVNLVNYLNYSATQAIAAVKAKIKANDIDPKKIKNYTVYVIVRKGTSDVVYVGMTKKYSARKSQHTGKGKRFPTSKYTMMPIATDLSKSQARALEQAIITAYSLDTLKNMINSISPKKWSDFTTEFDQMTTLMQSWIDPE